MLKKKNGYFKKHFTKQCAKYLKKPWNYLIMQKILEEFFGKKFGIFRKNFSKKCSVLLEENLRKEMFKNYRKHFGN